MSYSITISGNAGSRKGEAEALAKAAALAEELEARGEFQFSGEHFAVFASGPEDGLAVAKAALEEYAAEADTDDQVETPAS